MQNRIPSQLSDIELIEEVERLSICERRTTVELVAHLAELDARRLYLGAGFSSMFSYCTKVLRLSEGGAYNRIEAARAARRYPVILDLLGQGALNLATVRLLAPHLTRDNHGDLLAAASYKTRREVEELLARSFPQPDVAASVRKLPMSALAPPPHPVTVLPPPLTGPSTASLDGTVGDGPAVMTAAMGPVAEGLRPPSTPTPPPTPPPRLVTPLAPDRYQIRFTASARTCEKLRLAQDLLRHAVPDGDPAEVFDRALTALLEQLARRKFAATDRPRSSRGPSPNSRNIPARVKRAVMARDAGRCAFVAHDRRCGERAFLEFHHVFPYARGGQPTVSNIQLRCRAHNDYEAELCYGPRRPATGDGVESQGRTPYRAPIPKPTRPGTSSMADQAGALQANAGGMRRGRPSRRRSAVDGP